MILSDISRSRKDLSRIEAWFVARRKKGQDQRERVSKSTVWAANKRDYIGNSRV